MKKQIRCNDIVPLASFFVAFLGIGCFDFSQIPPLETDTDSSSNDTDSETLPDSNKEFDIETDTSSDLHNGTETTPDSDSLTDTDPSPDSDSLTDTESSPDSDSPADTESSPNSDSPADTESSPDSDALTDTESSPDSDSFTDTDPSPDSDALTDTESSPDSDSFNDTDTGQDSDTEDTDTENDTDTETDSYCYNDSCRECDSGPCCDENGQIIRNSKTICAIQTQDRCLHDACGSIRQSRDLVSFCSGTSAECDEKTYYSEWKYLENCAYDEICELDQEGVSECIPCASLQVCQSGKCECEFETCIDVCCAEGQTCRWSDTCGKKEAIIRPADGAPGDRFGLSVSVSGDIALIGAYKDDDNGDDSGSAYIFQRNMDGGWYETKKLLSSDGTASDWFGNSVSVSGSIAIVGAHLNDEFGADSGSAYIFERTYDGDWIETNKLLPSDGAVGDFFGYAVSVSEDIALIGALRNDDNQSDSGSAYIFGRNNDGEWIEITKLLASDGTANDWFGNSVSVNGKVAIVGAYRDNDFGAFSGSAYVFERNNDGDWVETKKLLPSDGAEDNRFGISVSVSGNIALIGAYGNDDNGSNSGAAYVFERTNDGDWIEMKKLLPSDGAEGDFFGNSVSVSGSIAIVGAHLNDEFGADSGSAYIYRRNTEGEWIEIAKLLPSDSAQYDYFGWSVSISGNVALVGAYGEDDCGAFSGSAYVY